MAAWRLCVNMGVLQVAHGCVEKTADEHGLLRGVEQSTMKADGGAIIGLMHGQSTNGSSRDMMQQGARVGAQMLQGPPARQRLLAEVAGCLLALLL
jgi:hypothetical protein